MNANGPVLRDIHLPPAPWWPPAPGWWLLAVLLALVAAAVAWWWTTRRVPRRIRRQALREVDMLQAAYAHDGDAAALASGASRLLRRIALRLEPGLAASHGEDWNAFLRGYAADDTAASSLAQLVEAPFRGHPTLDADALLAALRGWCRRALHPRSAARARRAGAGAAGKREARA